MMSILEIVDNFDKCYNFDDCANCWHLKKYLRDQNL